MTRPPGLALVRVRRQALTVGGRRWPVGAELRLGVDVATTLWGQGRVSLVQPAHPMRMTSA